MGTHTLRRVKPNDFVISLRSFQGGIEGARIEGAITFHYVVLTLIKDVYEPFFAHLFKSITYIQALRSTTNLIRDGQDLRFSHFVQVDLPIIPLDEQKAIATFLDIATSDVMSVTNLCKVIGCTPKLTEEQVIHRFLNLGPEKLSKLKRKSNEQSNFSKNAASPSSPQLSPARSTFGDLLIRRQHEYS